MNLSSNILDYLRIRFWLYEDSIFHYPEEKLTPATGLPPVEPKGKLIEICLQMFHAYTSLVRSEYPSFEQRRNSVDKRKVFFPNLGKTGHFDVIAIAFFNARVALKAVRPYSTASGNVPGYKMLYGVFSSVINFFKSDSPCAPAHAEPKVSHAGRFAERWLRFSFPARLTFICIGIISRTSERG